jgi:tetratricopeptide (TPR) repeat protein
MAEFAARSKFWRIGMAGVAGLLLLACGLDSRYQLSFWQDDITLFKRVVQVTPINNAMGYAYLGIAYQQAGDLEAAAESYTSALNATPDFPEVRTRLGTIQLQQKKYAAAEEQFRQLLTLHPDFVPVRKFLGCALAGQGKYQAARDEFEKLLNLQPDDDFTLKAMTEVSQKLAAEDALTNLFATMKDQPTSEIHAQIADLEASLGNYSEAVEHYQSALKLNPEAPEVENNLAWLLATCSDTTVRDGQQAVTLAQRACEQTGYGKTIYLGTLGAALAEAGRFDDAVASAQKACASASAHGENDLLKRNQELLALYQRHEPWHDPLPLPQPIPESPFESGSP